MDIKVHKRGRLLALILLVCIGAAGPIIDRLNSLSDVRTATPPSNGDALVYNSTLRKWTNGPVASSSGATVKVNGTNLTLFNLEDSTNYTLTLDGSGNVTIHITLAQTNTWYSLLSVTQFYSYEFYSSNVYITNLYVDQVTINNSTITNVTFVSNVTYNGRVENRKTSLGQYNALTMTGTNVSTVAIGSGMYFWLNLTNDGYVSAPAGQPGTNWLEGVQIIVQQDSTGGHSLGWATNWFGSATNTPSITTNAGTITVYTFITSPFSSTELFGLNQRVR